MYYVHMYLYLVLLLCTHVYYWAYVMYEVHGQSTEEEGKSDEWGERVLFIFVHHPRTHTHTRAFPRSSLLFSSLLFSHMEIYYLVPRIWCYVDVHMYEVHSTMYYVLVRCIPHYTGTHNIYTRMIDIICTLYKYKVHRYKVAAAMYIRE